jgi:CubicO group peptidase (beta-lactamase class C family)
MAAPCVGAFLDRLGARSIECHSLMVVRDGHVVAEGWWRPYAPDRPQLLYSLTKSFTSVAVGLAVADGRLALDDRVVDVLPEHVPADLSATAGRLTVHHLLSMTTGHRTDSLDDAWRLEPFDLVKGFLRVPLAEPPGTRHAYNNPTTFVLARMVERATGRTLPDLLADRLFGPMGIRHVEWDRVASGATFGFTGLHLTTEAVAAFGVLLLREGRWGDRQLVPREWVRLATRRHIETLPDEDGSRTVDWLQGYGYQFWMSQHGYRADGAFGQFCLVLPDRDLVVAVTAATTDTQAILDAAWQDLLPGVDRTGDPADDQALAERLGRLSLPPVPGERAPGRATRGRLDASGRDAILPPGTPVLVDPVPDGWRLRFAAADRPIDLDVGYGGWRESAPLGRPVAAAGAWQGAAFVADLCLTTSPHRVRLVVDADHAVLTWNIPPLVGPDLLRQLRSPLMTQPHHA